MNNNLSLDFLNNSPSVGLAASRKANNSSLYYVFVFVAAVTGLSVSVYFQHTIVTKIVGFTLMFCAVIFFRFIKFRPVWVQIAHAMLIAATLVNFNDAYLAAQSVNIVTIQLILLAILFSFYMLGKDWGLFYSLLNLVPTFVFFLLEYDNNYFSALHSGKVDLYELIISLMIDAALIVIFQFTYHKPFFKKMMPASQSDDEVINVSHLQDLTFKNDRALSEVTSEIKKTIRLKKNADRLSAGESGLRVLVAEDNPVNVVLVKKVLAKWHIVPTIALNGAEAIKLMTDEHFDIVLMDIQMPVLNGFDAAKGIRNLPDTQKARTPIIALTAAALTNIKEQVFTSGMNDYLPKPFKADDLMAKIHRLVAFA